MNVTHILASVSRANGGISESVRRLAQAQLASGADRVCAVSLADRHTGDDRPAWKPIEPECLAVVGPRAIGYAPGLTRAIERTRPDVTHVAGLWMYPSVANHRWAARSRRPYVVAPHGMLDAWALANSAWKKRVAAALFERRHLEGAACLHALCAAEADAIRAYGLRNPICIVPNGVDLPAPGSIPATAPWAGHGPDDRRVLLFLGRLHPKKGLRALLDGWAAAAPANWRLVIAGWDQGGHQAELESQVARLHLRDSVLFTGPLHGPAKAAAYGHASGFILPSVSEGLPMTILEAWAHGVPVLMTDACNLPEGFAARAAVRIPADSDGLARSLLRFTAMADAERTDLGRRGRDLAAGRFQWARLAREMLDVYSWAAGSGPRPECVRGGT